MAVNPDYRPESHGNGTRQAEAWRGVFAYASFISSDHSLIGLDYEERQSYRDLTSNFLKHPNLEPSGNEVIELTRLLEKTGLKPLNGTRPGRKEIVDYVENIRPMDETLLIPPHECDRDIYLGEMKGEDGVFKDRYKCSSCGFDSD